MPANPNYTRYHPKWYRVRIPIFWWIHKWAYLKFILRELTSLSVASYVLVLLFQIRALAAGEGAYKEFSAWLASPLSIVLHSIALLFVLFHTITWFNLAPKAMVIRMGKTRIAGPIIAVMNYIAWGVVSVVVGWIVLRI
jgi:fumarate reductase subunit C